MSNKISVKIVYHSGGVCIRRTANRKSKYKRLFTLEREYFIDGQVSSKHPKNLQYNLLISKALSEWQTKALNVQCGLESYESNPEEQLKVDKSEAKLSDLTMDYARRTLRLGKYRSHRKYTNVADKIIAFRDVKVKDLNKNYWQDFVKYLQDLPTINSATTVNRYLKFLKTVINYMNNEGYSIDRSLFNIKISGKGSPKQKLTKEEFTSIEELSGLDSKLELYKDIFCFQVHTWGTRIGDVLQMTRDHVVNNQLVFVEQKTGKTKTVEISDKLMALISKYEATSTIYIFPLLDMVPSDPKKDPMYQKHIESKTTMVNKGLKALAEKAKINKRVTTHVARHSFAVWASHADLEVRKIQQLLNHSSKSMTENYLTELNKDASLGQEADKVLNF